MEAIFGSEELTNLPQVVVIPYDKVYNQGISRNPSTKYACGSCASHWVVNAMNVDDSGLEMDWVSSRYEQLDDWEAYVWEGSTMGSRIDYMTEKEQIIGWYICKTPEDVHNAISKGHYVWSGSREINWTETRKSPNYAVYGWGSGHFFALAISDSIEEEFTWVNSYWEDAYDDGYFHTKREDFWELYSAVAFIDKKDWPSAELIQKRLDQFIKDNWHSATRQLIKGRRDDLATAQQLQLWRKLITM